MSQWDDRQYLKFADERTRPAEELLRRVPLKAAERVFDLGCGPGNSSALLRERWPEARLTGVDNSPEMLRAARKSLPDVEWIEADAASYEPPVPADLLFANAVFHWTPNHEQLFPTLLMRLRPGGVLALQMPHNFQEPSHRAMREVPGPWLKRTAEVRSLTQVASAAFYYDLLAPRASKLDIWETRYEHVMKDAQAIVEWVKGTGLRPYLDVLEQSERTAYLEAYRNAVDAAYPPRSDGKRLFSFPRLFIIAVR